MTTMAVRVALRVRPLFKSQDTNDDEQSIISFVKDEPQIYIGSDNTSFTFDCVYSPQSTQEQVYKSSIIPLLDRFIEGKNITILAYGQTGSGKTYSMGTGLESFSAESFSLDQGIIHRFANSLFERMVESSSKSLGKKSFQVYVSFLEIYNEDIHDLLVSTENTHPYSMSSSSTTSSSSNGEQGSHPSVREDVHGNIHWTGIKEEKVESANDLLGFLKKGSQCRTTGSTELNSSSHAIFSVILKQQQITNDDDIFTTSDADLNADNNSAENNILNLEYLPIDTQLVSKFHFVDLAGSERLKPTNALGELQKEGINGGLLALRNVISALGERDQHIPYRDSKLTRLLQDSLCGNSHTLMLACVSPSSSDYTETLNTLKYANRARNIQNRVEINFNEGEKEIHSLRTQVSRLKIQLAMLRGNSHLGNEMEVLREELDSIKSFSQEMTREVAKASSERDTLLLKLDDEKQPIQSRPLIQQYMQDLQTLKLQLAETQSKLNAIHHNHFLNTTYTSSSLIRPSSSGGREHTNSGPTIKVSSSMGYLDDNHLYVDSNSHSSYKKFPLSASSSRRLNKKKPVIQRMKTTQSTSFTKKRAPHHQNMDELLDLLRKEYILEEQENRIRGQHPFSSPRDNEMSTTDETVIHKSHAVDNTMTTMSFRAEAEFINEAFPSNQNIIMPPDTPISPTPPPQPTNLDEDELESLSVPSWSDASPKNQSSIYGGGSAKRKSISLDSMWDDTDSSITTSRVEASTTTTTSHWGKSTDPCGTKSKEMKSKSRNILKMLHQIQADLLVKRELVGQLERSEEQYTQMRVNFEERLNELKDHLLVIQKQRDAALKKSGTSIVPTVTATTVRPQSTMQLRENRQAQEVRSQYEVKLKRLISENQELRKKHTQSTQSIQTARAKAEGIIGRLRADVEALKLDKKQLNRGLKIEADKAREVMASYEKEIQLLKRREASALDARKKLEEVNEATNQVLRKRTEEAAAVNLQMRQLTNALRRAASEGTFLNEAALEKILNEANSSFTSPKNRRPRGGSVNTGNINGGGDSSIAAVSSSSPTE